jgi:SAM-dependent methyltransferase
MSARHPFLARVLRRLGWRIERLRPRPAYPGEVHRWEYQRPVVDFRIAPGELVLDVGCGNDPFPHATHLVDLHLEATRHRHEAMRRPDRPLVIADTARLPFSDRGFGFVYCAHVLEHVDDPIHVCRELMRIGRRGFIETPAFAKDALFAWAEGMHRWHVVAIADHLVFFEYDPRQLQGVRSSTWRDAIFHPNHHPLQDLFFANQEIFNTMLSWEGGFSVHVFRLDGSYASLLREGAAAR